MHPQPLSLTFGITKLSLCQSNQQQVLSLPPGHF